MRASSILIALASCVATLALMACPTPPSTDVQDAFGGDTGGGFDDHTTSFFESADQLRAWGMTDEGHVQVKFTLTGFQATEGHAFFYDPHFFKLHDEWYWFRLLNGASIPLFGTVPVDGLSFDSVEAIYDDFAGKTSLPLDLRWTQGDRLYSPRFYDAALGRQQWNGKRAFGVGSLLYYPADPLRVFPDEIYAFELEFVDDSDEAGLQHFFDRLRAKLPHDVAGKLMWISRGSTHQDALAAQLRQSQSPLRDRVLTYADLVVPGEEVPYNEGITAGYLKLFEDGVGGTQVGPQTIAVLANVPDYLPPVAGIVTAVPQTPLAHLNLLAKARGTPNIYVGGIFTHQWLEEWAYWGKAVILKVSPAGATWKVISKGAYDAYLAKKQGASRTIPQVDLDTAPFFVDLAQGSLAEYASLIPLTGGKSAAMKAFAAFPEMETPFLPLAITLRPYAEHLMTYRPLLQTAMASEDFQNDSRVRYVFLEGHENFLEEHAADPTAGPWLAAWLDANGPASALGGPVALGGFKRLLRAKPLDPTFKADLETTLKTRYAALSPEQSLRFRSSSTAEDIKGFNGAGLYDSNTGTLYPEVQPTDKLKKRDVAWALKKTWASYWTYEAFEERRLAGIDHLSGNMGVLVHPRFDDPAELANGVISFTLKRQLGGDLLTMTVNVQAGAISVTNPDPAQPTTPEIDQVTATLGAAPTLIRVQGSSEVSPGDWVLTEDALLTLHQQIGVLIQVWLDTENEAYSEAQGSSTLVLDLEFKRMHAEWPQLDDGSVSSDRLIMKQARTLEGSIKVGEDLAAEPVPRDLLTVTRKVTLRECEGADLAIALVEFYTETGHPLFNYDDAPFVARAIVQFKEDIPGFSTTQSPKGVVHTHWSALSYGDFPNGPWSLNLDLTSEAAQDLGFETLNINADGVWTLTAGAAAYQGQPMICTVETLSIGPTEYLESLLSEP